MNMLATLFGIIGAFGIMPNASDPLANSFK
jgi:hypothetical protein